MRKSDIASEFKTATGAHHRVGYRLAEQRLIFPGFVVPDAATPAQRELEALLWHTSAYVVRDLQIGGALLGVMGVRPMPSRLEVQMHKVMQRHLITELLPNLDGDGFVRGVPGLRFALTATGLLLYTAHSDAQILITSWEGPPPFVPFQKHFHPISGALARPEADELRKWRGPDARRADAARRDLLLSRIGRRPRLLNLAGDAHGLANTYIHHPYDLVVEYCCGPSALSLAQTLIRSGVTGVPHAQPDVGKHDIRVPLGQAELVLRRGSSCGMSDDYSAEYLRLLATCTAEDYGPDVHSALSAPQR